MACLLTVQNKSVYVSIDGFHSIFLLWQLEGKGSCDVDIDQSSKQHGDVMPSSSHSKMRHEIHLYQTLPMGGWVWPCETRSSVSKLTEGISTFSFCSALNKVYFVV